MVGVGIIGAGFMGTTHGKAYARNPDARVIVVADQVIDRAEALATQVGGRAVAEPDAVLEDPSVDLVDVSLPTPCHAEYAIRAMQSGKHVVLEKPLALSLQEGQAILDTAQRTGRYLMVAHVLRFWPEYQAIRDYVQSGRLGQPLVATARRLSSMPQWATWFRAPEATGGVTLDLQIHDLDMFNWLLGAPRRVFAIGVKVECGGWLHAITLVEYETARASAEASYMMPKDFPFTAEMRVLFQNGAVEYCFRAEGASIESGTPSSCLKVHEAGRPSHSVPFVAGDAYERETAYFVECVREGHPPVVVTPEDALLAIQTSLAARSSLETGETISLSG